MLHLEAVVSVYACKTRLLAHGVDISSRRVPICCPALRTSWTRDQDRRAHRGRALAGDPWRAKIDLSQSGGAQIGRNGYTLNGQTNGL